MYIINRDTEIALIEVAVMHPNTTIDELLMIWVRRFYHEHEKSFDCCINQSNSTPPEEGRASSIQPLHQTVLDSSAA